MVDGLRACRKCKATKPLTAFDKCPRGENGRRRTCRRCKDEARGDAPTATPRFHRALDSKRYIITSAQNATPVDEQFFKTLQIAAKHLDAELVVIPLRYRNPTSIWNENNKRDDWWPEEVVPYLFNQRKKLCPNLVLAADVKMQPTAGSPLSGFEGLTGGESCIFGHPKMQMVSVPVPPGSYPKLLTTTGACTKRNYTDSKSGKLGAFHHFLGALVVETEGKWFTFRQINADRADGSFIDLDKHFSTAGVKKAPRALGLATGDSHAMFIDPKVDAATYGKGGMVDVLDPEAIVFHDVHDGYATNPHHRGNPFIARAKFLGQATDVRKEVEHCVEFVRTRAKGRKAIIVASNHDDFLSRWVINSDWKTDPKNAPFYLETAQAMFASVKLGPQGAEYADPFAYWVERMKNDADIRCLKIDESFKLADVECGMHGHHGPNGSVGSVKGFARIGARTITGHGHAPAIEEGHYRLGTSTPLKLEYTHGPGSWLNTHCVVYANGKRALLTVIDGRWRL